MDIATHALVPMAGALAALGFLRREEPGDRGRAAAATVFGIAGFSPDIDGIIDPLSEMSDSLYWLQHRGVSHTLVGAPVFAIVTLLALVWAARLFPRRMGLFAYRPLLVPAAILGSWTHLVLDAITYSGVPLLWPFAFGRYGFFLFHWLVFWLLPIGALVLGLHAFGRLSRRRVAQAGFVVMLILVVLAGQRAASRPWDEPPEARVFSTNDADVWTIATPEANGTWRVERWRDGARFGPMWFEERVPAAAEEAVARARATDAHRGFLMGSFGPVVTVAEREGDAWNVTITDIAQRYESIQGPRWAPVEPFTEWGYVRYLVHPDRVDVLHRGW